MGSPCVSRSGFNITWNECGSEWVNFEYDGEGGIKMVCGNCNNSKTCKENIQDNDEVTVVFENLESFVIRKKYTDLLFDDSEMICKISFKEEDISNYDDWYEDIGAYDRIMKHPDICNVYINHGTDNQMKFDTKWIDDGDDNLLQKTSINDDKLIIVTFTEAGE